MFISAFLSIRHKQKAAVNDTCVCYVRGQRPFTVASLSQPTLDKHIETGVSKIWQKQKGNNRTGEHGVEL